MMAKSVRPDGTIECEQIVGCTVERREPYTGGVDMTPASLNVRPVETIYPHEAPDPVRTGDTPSRPARMPIAVFQAVAPIKAVQEDSFGTDLWAPIHIASTPFSYALHTESVNAWGERANVQRPESRPYGSNFEVGADDAKLLQMGIA